MEPYHWQRAHVDAFIGDPDLERGEFALVDGSDTGTGKMHMTCAIARAKGWRLVVVCPKAVRAEWVRVGGQWGVDVVSTNYERIRAGENPELGSWQKLPPAPLQRESEGFVWVYPDPARTLLVFDEAHLLGGEGSLTSALGIGARRQRRRTLLLSATLMMNPEYGYAIGYMMGLHALINFRKWTQRYGVELVQITPERRDAKGKVVRKAKHAYQYAPSSDEESCRYMESLRQSMGTRFKRIRKAEVPDFPRLVVGTSYIDTDDMPELENEFGMEARVCVERLMLPGVCELIDLHVAEGNSVAVFVNFVESMNYLREKYPEASAVFGGQTEADRTTSVNNFSEDLTNIIFVNGAAGGAGLSLHDRTGRPRVGLVIPGWSAIQFQQILGRLHRAGSLSPAVYFVLFASGAPVMRRIRQLIDEKIANLANLNDADLLAPGASDPGRAPQSPEPPRGGTPRVREPDHQCERAIPDLPGPDVPGPANRTRTPEADNVSTLAPAINNSSEVEHSVRKHARCSPSKLKALALCPSFANDDSRPTHPVTLRGTAMHEAMETGNDQHLDDEERQLVRMCREFIAEDLAVAAEVIQEIHVTTHDPDVAGFLDMMLVMPPKANGMKTAKIRDWKFGFNLVPSPEENPQAIAYTVGVFMKRPDIDEIEFAFCIPRCDVVLVHTFHRSQLQDLQLGLSAIANRVRTEADLTYTPHLDNCQYCAKLGRCPATWERALRIGAGVKDPADRLPLPESFNPANISTPEDMAKALNLAYLLEAWVEQVKSAAHGMRHELGFEIPGYDWVESAGRRTVTNTPGAFEIASQFGVTQEEFLRAASVSLPQLTEAVRTHAEGRTKKEAQQAFEDALTNADFISRGTSYHTLRRSKKKAVVQSLPA